MRWLRGGWRAVAGRTVFGGDDAEPFVERRAALRHLCLVARLFDGVRRIAGRRRWRRGWRWRAPRRWRVGAMGMGPQLCKPGGACGDGEAAFSDAKPALGGGKIAACDGAVHVLQGAARGGVVGEGHGRHAFAFGPACAARDDPSSPLEVRGRGARDAPWCSACAGLATGGCA